MLGALHDLNPVTTWATQQHELVRLGTTFRVRYLCLLPSHIAVK